MTDWRKLKVGDRVRVTFDGKVEQVVTGEAITAFNLIHVSAASGTYWNMFAGADADATTWELLDPPLRVGPAKYTPNGKSCQVLAIHEGLAWIKYDRGGYETISAHHFENIDEEPQP